MGRRIKKMNRFLSWRSKIRKAAFQPCAARLKCGLIGLLLTMWTGDGSAVQVARHQPMKLAAMEGLYHGSKGQSLAAIAYVNPDKEWDDDNDEYLFEVSLPYGLSILANHKVNSFVPGISDIIKGYTIDDNGDTINTVGYAERIARGKLAQKSLAEYDAARKAGDEKAMLKASEELKENYPYFGYAYFKDVKEAIPPVGLTFVMFRIMVFLGTYFLAFFVVALLLVYNRGWIDKARWFNWVAMLSVPFMYLCSQAGWAVAEVGRQPWTIQDLLPTVAAISDIPVSSVITTFWMFAVVFTLLLVAEVSIMVKYVEKKSKEQLYIPEKL